MKKEIEITRTKKYKEVFEIDFPVYRKIQLGEGSNGSDVYLRTDSNFIQTEIKIYWDLDSSDKTFGFSIGKVTPSEVLPGFHSTQINSKLFNKKLREVKIELNNIHEIKEFHVINEIRKENK